MGRDRLSMPAVHHLSGAKRGKTGLMPLRHGLCTAPGRTDLTRPQVKQMSRNDPTSRPDRILFAVLAVVLATASAVLGAGMTYRPQAPAVVVAAAAPALPFAQEMVLAEHRCLAEALYYEARSEGAR